MIRLVLSLVLLDLIWFVRFPCFKKNDAQNTGVQGKVAGRRTADKTLAGEVLVGKTVGKHGRGKDLALAFMLYVT